MKQAAGVAFSLDSPAFNLSARFATAVRAFFERE
jgi:hypothetical protein